MDVYNCYYYAGCSSKQELIRYSLHEKILLDCIVLQRLGKAEVLCDTDACDSVQNKRRCERKIQNIYACHLGFVDQVFLVG